jgi:hypothetical protein
LAKDHFSNYLNPIAGRIASATTNWTTQRIIECWDSDDDSIVSPKVESILSILHHPAFFQGSKQTPIQKIMFNIIDQWWKQRSAQQLVTLRQSLSKAGIHGNADGHSHGDNNPVLDAAFFTGSRGFAADWAGAKPDLKERKEQTLSDGVLKLLNEASKAVEQAQVQIQRDIQQTGTIINQGINTAAEIVDRTAKNVADEAAKTIIHQIAGDTPVTREVVDEAQRQVQLAFERQKREAEEAYRQTQRAAEILLEQRRRELEQAYEKTKKALKFW